LKCEAFVNTFRIQVKLMSNLAIKVSISKPDSEVIVWALSFGDE